jgi:hypothetical protein
MSGKFSLIKMIDAKLDMQYLNISTAVTVRFFFIIYERLDKLRNYH